MGKVYIVTRIIDADYNEFEIEKVFGNKSDAINYLNSPDDFGNIRKDRGYVSFFNEDVIVDFYQIHEFDVE